MPECSLRWYYVDKYTISGSMRILTRGSIPSDRNAELCKQCIQIWQKMFCTQGYLQFEINEPQKNQVPVDSTVRAKKIKHWLDACLSLKYWPSLKTRQSKSIQVEWKEPHIQSRSATFAYLKGTFFKEKVIGTKNGWRQSSRIIRFLRFMKMRILGSNKWQTIAINREISNMCSNNNNPWDYREKLKKLVNIYFHWF